MKTPLYKRYADRRPVGSVCLCNTFGVLVFEPMEEDKPDTDFITAWSGSEGQTWGYHRNNVHYTAALEEIEDDFNEAHEGEEDEEE